MYHTFQEGISSGLVMLENLQVISNWLTQHSEYKYSDSNTAAITKYLTEKNIVVSPESLDRVAEALGSQLERPKQKGTKENRLMDAGIRPFTALRNLAEPEPESPRVAAQRKAREEQEARALRQQAIKECNITVQYPNGRQNHKETADQRAAAKARWRKVFGSELEKLLGEVI